MFKRNWHWALVVLIILGIGSFVVFRPKAQVETVKVYKTVTPAPKPALAETSETDRRSDVQTQSLDETVAVPIEPEAVETRLVNGIGTQEVSPTEENEVSQETPTKAGESENLLYGDYTKEELARIKEWGEDLRDRLLAEYADLTELADMTPEQIAEKYPTDEDRQHLAERGKKFFEEYLEETRALLVSLPEPIREKAFEQIHNEFAKSWGSEAADQLVGQIIELIFLKSYCKSVIIKVLWVLLYENAL